MNYIEYIVGIDLGQMSEFTALAIVEKKGWCDEAIFSVRQLKRYEPGTSYLQIIADVVGMITDGPLKRTILTIIVDGTSAGAAVVEMFRSRLEILGAQVMAVLISGGDTQSEDSGWTRVPKRDLVSAVQVLLQTERLRIAQALPEARTLVRELSNFKVQTVVTSVDPLVAWREGSSDDLVLALALPVWLGMQREAGSQEYLAGKPRSDPWGWW